MKDTIDPSKILLDPFIEGIYSRYDLTRSKVISFKNAILNLVKYLLLIMLVYLIIRLLVKIKDLIMTPFIFIYKIDTSYLLAYPFRLHMPG